MDSTRAALRTEAEEQIARLLDLGDYRGAVANVVKWYGPTILAYLGRFTKNRTDAEDVFGQFNVDLLRGIAGFRRDCPIIAWSYRVAYHAAVRFARKRPLKIHRLDSEELDQIKAGSLSSVREWDNSQAGRIFEQLKAQLSPDEQTLLTLHIYEELGLGEIAALMGTKDATVRQRWSRLLRKLRRAAQAEGQEGGAETVADFAGDRPPAR